MNVLWIAYKIEKNKGSEDGMAYHLVPQLRDKGMAITLVSRRNNIEKLRHDPQYDGIEMIGIDVPRWLSWFKKGNRGIIAYYYLWQICVGLLVRRG